jgi:hypothetical protein
MENFLMQGFFNPQRVAEFEAYLKALPDDSVAPKLDLLEGVENVKKTQQQIAQINARAQIMQQRAQQFLMDDPEGQASQMADAMSQLQMQQFANQEAELDGQVAEEESIVDNTDDN